jgi:putative SOS response-associated peptidase YedK
MPVIIEHADYGSWLSGSLERAGGLMKKYPANQMKIANIGLNTDD